MSDQEKYSRPKSYASLEMEVFVGMLALELTDAERDALSTKLLAVLRRYDEAKTVDAKHVKGMRSLADLLRRNRFELIELVGGFWATGEEPDHALEPAPAPPESLDDAPFDAVPMKPPVLTSDSGFETAVKKELESLLTEYTKRKYEEGLHPWPIPMVREVKVGKDTHRFIAVGTANLVYNEKRVNVFCQVNAKALKAGHTALIRDGRNQAILRSNKQKANGDRIYPEPADVRYVWAVRAEDGLLLHYYGFEDKGPPMPKSQMWGMYQAASNKIVRLTKEQYQKEKDARMPKSEKSEEEAFTGL